MIISVDLKRICYSNVNAPKHIIFIYPVIRLGAEMKFSEIVGLLREASVYFSPPSKKSRIRVILLNGTARGDSIREPGKNPGRASCPLHIKEIVLLRLRWEKNNKLCAEVAGMAGQFFRWLNPELTLQSLRVSFIILFPFSALPPSFCLNPGDRALSLFAITSLNRGLYWRLYTDAEPYKKIYLQMSFPLIGATFEESVITCDSYSAPGVSHLVMPRLDGFVVVCN